MRTLCKKLFPGMVLLMMTLLLTIPAFAAELEFSDVPTDSPWHESVMYLAEHGITAGTGEGRYSPDAPITVRQWAVMLCRAYDKSEALASEGEFGAACLTEAYSSGWLSVEALAEPDTRMCRGSLFQSAFSVADLPVYDYILYPDGETLSTYENCLRIGTELGLCSEDAEPMEIVTRGEAAALLHAILTQEFSVDEPPMLTELPIQNDEGVNMNDYLLELRRVPEPILQQFQDKRWVYTVNFQYLADLSERYDMTCIGAASYASKRIYVSQATATVHEFGHFLDGVQGFPSTSTSFYVEEAQASSAFLRDYAQTNCREYYAEYFAYWLNNHDDAKKAEQMQQLTPKTYEYFTELAANNWALPAK